MRARMVAQAVGVNEQRLIMVVRRLLGTRRTAVSLQTVYLPSNAGSNIKVMVPDEEFKIRHSAPLLTTMLEVPPRNKVDESLPPKTNRRLAGPLAHQARDREFALKRKREIT